MHLDPLLPLPAVAVMSAVAIGLIVARLRRRAPGPAIARAAALVALAAAIALDPAIAGGTGEARRAAADVLFVVDTTSSMAALDYGGDSPRLDGVRADIVELAGQFPGAHFSLVRFDSQARLELPWTTDFSALETAVSVLRQERALYSRGSRLDLPLDVIDQQLPRASRAASDDRYSIVFFFSDGEQRAGASADPPAADRRTGLVPDEEDLAEGTIESYAELAHEVDGGAVFGYGTAAGAPMLEFVGIDQLFTASDSPFVHDFATGAPAISRLDEDNLVEISDQLGTPYVHRSEPGGLATMASALAKAAPTVTDGSRATPQRLYWIPALGLLALLLWQAAATAREALATRQLFGGAPNSMPKVEPEAPDEPGTSRHGDTESAA
jgi:Ca-activated chloride channel family protein